MTAPDLATRGYPVDVSTLALLDLSHVRVVICFSFNHVQSLLLPYRFVEVTPHVLGMANVTRLFLGHNGLTSLPSLRSLQSLVELDLSNNHIRDIHPDIIYNDELATLNLENNDLQQYVLELEL